MKLSIEKLAHGPVRVEILADGMKKPVAVTLDAAQLAALLSILDMARRADRFAFTLEL